LSLTLSYCEVHSQEAIDRKKQQVREYGDFTGLSKEAVLRFEDDLTRDDLPF
jgi:hypothetical protein